jgi:hypothetical protein
MEGCLTELLWMEEDELRYLVVTLATRLCQTREVIQEAYEYGYRQGYTTRALQLTPEVEVGDEQGVVLH